MIALKCPHCQVGLKVDRKKLPEGIKSFKCPKCRKEIPVNLLNTEQNTTETSTDTVLLGFVKEGMGRITVIADKGTPEQVFSLYEGLITIGRNSLTSEVNLRIITDDRLMSRNHISIEVKKDSKGGYKHYLSDNNSKNHTLYNNKYLEDGEVVVLNDKDEIVIGRTTIRFNV